MQHPGTNLIDGHERDQATLKTHRTIPNNAQDPAPPVQSEPRPLDAFLSHSCEGTDTDRGISDSQNPPITGDRAAPAVQKVLVGPSNSTTPESSKTESVPMQAGTQEVQTTSRVDFPPGARHTPGQRRGNTLVDRAAWC